MARFALALFLFFALLLVLRALRVFLGPLMRRRDGEPPIAGEMVRDPVCGIWVDRRIALAGRKGDQWLPVCSEKCRRVLESP